MSETDAGTAGDKSWMCRQRLSRAQPPVLLSCPPQSLVPRAQLPSQTLGIRGDLRQNANTVIAKSRRNFGSCLRRPTVCVR
jgi:hypothetical protein